MSLESSPTTNKQAPKTAEHNKNENLVESSTATPATPDTSPENNPAPEIKDGVSVSMETESAEMRPQAESSPAAVEGPSIEGEEDMNTPINPEKQILDLQESMAKIESRISTLEQIQKVRESLSDSDPEKIKETQAEIEGLKLEEQKLQEEKEDAERLQDLEMVLEELHKLSPTELRIIIQTGKTSEGKELESKHGKVSPEVAKSLAQAAEDGVTKLTKAFLKTILGIVKGVLKAIFQTIKEEVGGATGR